MRWFTATLTYLWSGWGAITSLLLLLALWQWGHSLYGELVLPSPTATFAQMLHFYQQGKLIESLTITGQRALIGFLLSMIVGTLLGVIAGRYITTAMMSRPIITVLVGTPPIAWLVLAMLWFGSEEATPIFTVFIACFPIIFIGALQGAKTLDGYLHDLAHVYQLPWSMRLGDVYLPHVISYLFPAWIAALGMSWKIVVMVELLATSDGIGAALAVSRSHLDTAASMAWISAIIFVLLAIEYLVLEPIKRHVEAWREGS